MSGDKKPKSYIDEDGRWQHRTRTTFYSSYAHCPEQAAAIYFDEIEEDDTQTDSTVRGQAVHAGIEFALNTKRDSHVPARQACIDVVDAKLAEMWPWKIQKAQPKTTRRHANLMFNAWYDEILPICEPLHMERQFRMPIVDDEKRTVWLTGGIDFEDTEHVCWDWKTAAREYEPWEYQRWAVQPTSYSAAAWAMRHYDPAYWTDEQVPDGQRRVLHGFPEFERLPEQWFRYCIMLENGGIQILDVVRDAGHVRWLQAQALQVAQLIESGIRPWPLNDHGWWCGPKWCPKFDSCKGLHMTEGWEKVRK